MRRALLPAALVAGLLVAAPGPAAAQPGPGGPLVVTVPGQATAGDPLTVSVLGAADGDVALTVVGSLAATGRTVRAEGGVARFELGEELTRAAGSLTLVASAGDAAATATTTLVPGPAVGPVQPVVGARSIVADAADRSMAVAVPVDRLGNAVADGTPVQVLRARPDGVLETGAVTVRDLVAWALLPSGTVAGRGQVSVQAPGAAGPVTGPQVSLDEVAAPPVPFTLEPVDPRVAAGTGADGQSLVAVRTAVLRDPFGNVEPDGTAVTVAWQGAGGSSRTTAVTVAGVATATVPAPEAPDTLVVTAECRGTATTAPLRLGFGPVVREVAVRGSRSDAGVAVDVGPVRRDGGAYVPDGARVSVEVRDAAGVVSAAAGRLRDGVLAVVVPPAAAWQGPLVVSAAVLGAVGTSPVP